MALQLLLLSRRPCTLTLEERQITGSRQDPHVYQEARTSVFPTILPSQVLPVRVYVHLWFQIIQKALDE
jgi:hypothetical protein